MSNISVLRKRQDLTQRQLAEQVGVTESTVRNWERDRNGVEWFERVANLCEALGCSPRDLVRYVDAAEEGDHDA